MFKLFDIKRIVCIIEATRNWTVILNGEDNDKIHFTEGF